LSIQLQNVTKVFGRFAALRGVSHEFRSGTLSVITGGNGAGKSTLLRIIAGLTHPSSGASQTQGRIGYMGHASMLYDELTGLENLRYFSALYGRMDDAALSERMRLVDLDPVLQRSARDYSQGMRQRLSLARANVHDPDVLLLDEPFSNVDAESAAHICALLVQWRDAGKTLVVVTHQPELLQAIADERVAMLLGRIDSVTSLREVPA